MLIVNLEQYGDFDIPVTVSTWVSEHFENFKDTGLDNSLFKNDRDCLNAERVLKKLGFKKAKVGTVTIGGNL